MHQYKLIAVLLFTVLFHHSSGQPKSKIIPAPTGLMCDLLANTVYRSNNGYPVSPDAQVDASNLQEVLIANNRPSFSWQMNSSTVNNVQTAYQIQVFADATSLKNGKVYWDSRKAESRHAADINYSGPALETLHRYLWRVRVWDSSGAVSAYSQPAIFKTAGQFTDYATERYPIEKTDQHPTFIKQTQHVTFIDFGKDAFGQLKFRLTAAKGGENIQIRIGEALSGANQINRNPGGTIRYAEYSLSLQAGTHEYNIIPRSDKRNTGPNAIKMPAYIGEVTPFRYCEIEGPVSAPKPGDITRVFVHYPFNDQAATFHSSDTLLNRVWNLCKYTVKATSFAGVYIDGDRERIPYEADAYINQLCHYAVDREYTLARYSHEYLINHATWPTEWILQSVLIAGNDYLYTGDIRSARHYYNELKAKSLMALEDKNGLISIKNTTPQLLKDIHIIMRKDPHGLDDIVDWPHTGMLGLNQGEGGETDGFVFTDYNAVVNAYYYQALRAMETMSAGLGETQDSKMYHNRADALKHIYKNLFWDEKQGLYCDGVTTRHPSLHTNMFALTFGLVDSANIKHVAAFIRSRGMACSVYGSQFLLDALYDAGEADYALQLMTNRTDRSWYNMMKIGSTLTLEAWDNKFKPNQDWNHIWGAAPLNIISRKLMGVEPLTPGWEKFKIAPQPGSLSNADITVPTIKGTVKVAFKQSEKALLVSVDIPANTVADVYLPAMNNVEQILFDRHPIKTQQLMDRWFVPGVGSGHHEFVVVAKGK